MRGATQSNDIVLERYEIGVQCWAYVRLFLEVFFLMFEPSK